MSRHAKQRRVYLTVTCESLDRIAGVPLAEVVELHDSLGRKIMTGRVVTAQAQDRHLRIVEPAVHKCSCDVLHNGSNRLKRDPHFLL